MLSQSQTQRNISNINNTDINNNRIVCNGYNVILDSLFYAYSRNYRGDNTNTNTNSATSVHDKVRDY